MDFITNNSGNIALAFMIIYSVMKLIAPYTKSTTDDQVVKAIDDVKAWVETNAPGVWAKVEALSTKGNVSGPLNKLAIFLHQLNEAHIEDTGAPLPVSAMPSAKRQAAALSAADVLAKAAVASVPPAAPASK